MKVNIGKYPKKGTRQIDIRIDSYDTWSMDHTLAYIILPLLMQLKETKHGVPSEFGQVGGENYSSQQSFEFYEETNSWAFDESCKKWDEILDKMIWSFQQLALEDYDNQYHHGEPKLDWVETDQMHPNPLTGKQEKTYQMVDLNPEEHWYDHVGHMMHEERIQEGLNLFAKYYRSLWD